MNTYKVTWEGGTVQTREATDMRVLLSALIVGEGRPEPLKVKRLKGKRR